MTTNRKLPQRTAPTPGWAVYLRTSTDQNQKPEYSRERQRVLIQSNLLNTSHLPVFDEYIDVLSGRDPSRKGYQRMLADARRGKFSYVVAERADRFGRDDKEALRAIDELSEYGIGVRFANAPDIDPMDPDGRVLIVLTFALARRESSMIGIRVRGGLQAKRLSGGFVGRAPDGYINIHDESAVDTRGITGRTNHWIEVDPDRAHIWREAWKMLLTDSMSLEDIVEVLHSRGFSDRNDRPFVEVFQNGSRRIHTAKLRRAFQNWTYAGWVVNIDEGIEPKSIRGNWDPIVSTEDFERGLEILKKLQSKT